MAAAHAQPGRPKGALGWYIHIVNRISFVCGVLAAAALALAVLIICQLVFMRYVMQSSTVWQTETVIFLMIGSTVIGMPYVQSLRGHVNVDLLPLYLGAGARRVLYYICMVAALGTCLLIFWYSLEMAHEAYVYNWRSASVWRPRLWMPYATMPVGFGLMCLQLIGEILAVATGREKPFGLPDEITNPLELRQEH